MAGIPNQLRIEPGTLNGDVKAPPSKSVMQRVLALLFLRNGSLEIRNPGLSADDRTLLAILESAGFRIEAGHGSLKLMAPSAQRLGSVDFGDSGLAARALLPVLATRTERIGLRASEQLRNRGFGPLTDVLLKAGAKFEFDNAGWPSSVQGPLHGTEISIDGSFSSQPVTGLLYALAAGSEHAMLRVENAASTSYIDLSLQVMEDLGFAPPKRDGHSRFEFAALRPLKPLPSSYTIEGDWSAAAFWLVAGAIAGPLRVSGLDGFSTQGDKAVLQALMDAGAGLSIRAEQITVRPATLNAFHFDATHTPDLFPPLAVLGCFAKGQSVIEGVGRLAQKESNRAETIMSELSKLGADIRIQDDIMIVTGKPLQSGVVESHEDHRIVMMAAIAALGANGPVTIQGSEAVAKSYPAFFDDFKALGGICDMGNG